MEDNRWRFKGNGYTADSGLNTADIETFKKDSMASLAREICQNSIDAVADETGEKPVHVEFVSFDVPREAIPGIDELSAQIQACINTDIWQNDQKVKSQLEQMQKQINLDSVACLRISDFNTTGLYDIQNKSNDSPYHALIHGTGLSNKTSSSGGSKGIGKYAAFGASSFNTVFYSTKTKKDEKAYVGICKLCSAEMEGTQEKTQGIGYFGSTEQNEPILSELTLDKTFTRQEHEWGTDIYIIGFKKPKDWKTDIVCKVLDSFMAAIMFNCLSVKVDDIDITADSLKDIVSNNEIINSKNVKSIRSQYALLTDKEHRFEDTISTPDFNNAAKLYTLRFDNDDVAYATNGCVMIRKPFMKIKDLENITRLPSSAMCIIEDPKLAAILRDIENPQHTDWEFNRIDDESQKKEVKAIFQNLKDEIKKAIIGHLSSSEESKADINGAGDYLPAAADGDNQAAGKQLSTLSDTPSIRTKKVRHLLMNTAADIPDENGDGLVPSIGSGAEQGETIFGHTGINDGILGPNYPGTKRSGGQASDDDQQVYKRVELRGIKFSFYCINKKERKYGIVFTANQTESNVRIELNALDDSGAKEPVAISRMIVDGRTINIDGEGFFSFPIQKGKTVKVEMITNQEELFSGEAKLIARQ